MLFLFFCQFYTWSSQQLKNPPLRRPGFRQDVATVQAVTFGQDGCNIVRRCSRCWDNSWLIYILCTSMCIYVLCIMIVIFIWLILLVESFDWPVVLFKQMETWWQLDLQKTNAHSTSHVNEFGAYFNSENVSPLLHDLQKQRRTAWNTFANWTIIVNNNMARTLHQSCWTLFRWNQIATLTKQTWF